MALTVRFTDTLTQHIDQVAPSVSGDIVVIIRAAKPADLAAASDSLTGIIQVQSSFDDNEEVTWEDAEWQ